MSYNTMVFGSTYVLKPHNIDQKSYKTNVFNSKYVLNVTEYGVQIIQNECFWYNFDGFCVYLAYFA